MQFDPVSARSHYARKETDELIRIAYLETTFVDEAKALAREELSKRGIENVDAQTIERVRTRLESQDRASEEYDLETRSVADELLGNLHMAAAIGGLWLCALFLPDMLANPGDSNWTLGFLAVLWGCFAVIAVRDALRGERKKLYLIVVVPLTLLIVSIAVRWGLSH